ncbi:hypothetical protein LSUE1_G008735, partial [Lachnellula suecica]
MSSTSPKKHIVFDVVGTLVSYSTFYTALETRLGPKLLAQGIKPSLLAFTWIEAAEREYTYLSISGKYMPFFDVFRALFWRMLFKAGVEKPREFASVEDLDFIMTSYQNLTPRPGAAECFNILRAGGFTMWAYTAGDLKRVGGYFSQANIHSPEENLLSCDTYGIGKPAKESYIPVIEKLRKEGGDVEC